MATLTGDGETELTVAPHLYDEEEFQEMTADVLLSMPDKDLPDIPSDDWKPDF